MPSNNVITCISFGKDWPLTPRLMARDLDISPLAAEIVLQALRPVVHEHFDVEPSGASLDNVVAGAESAADDADVDEL